MMTHLLFFFLPLTPHLSSCAYLMFLVTGLIVMSGFEYHYGYQSTSFRHHFICCPNPLWKIIKHWWYWYCRAVHEMVSESAGLSAAHEIHSPFIFLLGTYGLMDARVPLLSRFVCSLSLLATGHARLVFEAGGMTASTLYFDFFPQHIQVNIHPEILCQLVELITKLHLSLLSLPHSC